MLSSLGVFPSAAWNIGIGSLFFLCSNGSTVLAGSIGPSTSAGDGKLRKILVLAFGAWLLLAANFVPVPVWADQNPTSDDTGIGASSLPLTNEPAADVNWLEPRGLNIVDLVGWVPDSDLAGAIIQYTPGYGILRYRSGQRVGNTVTITATAYPRFYAASSWNGSLFGCLGQGARIDELGTVAPATKLRVYTPDGQEVTRQVDGLYHVPSGHNSPIRNPRESEQANLYRYWETDLQSATFAADGALLLPANMGCELIISYKDYRELTLVFTAEVAPVVSVKVVGRQSFQFPVYFGPGFAGHFDALRNQLARSCSQTPPVVATMAIPPGADYFLFNYPPMPVDPYTSFPPNPQGNVDRPAGVSYRLLTPSGLTVDHVISPGLPLYGHWIDVDVAPNSQYLPYSRAFSAFGGLEILVPAGVSYDSCMLSGTCSAAKLQQICSTATPARMIYLQVERTQSGLSRIPLQMPGSQWHPPAAAALTESEPEAPTEVGSAQAAAALALKHKTYLPLVSNMKPSIEPDDPTGCSVNGGCGWFTLDGRMVDYIQAP
jgi:hypothetical protein